MAIQEMTYREAVRQAMVDEMQRDPNVFTWARTSGAIRARSA
ncbi:MAG: hypothetical protein WHU10_03475 [Fimbriimonadales bacterium]